MGLAVNCQGADLLRELNSDKNFFLRQYPLYVIALATEMDDEAIKWLVEYGRVLDSLTGEHIAFVTFYNSVRFRATIGEPRQNRNFIDEVGTREIFSPSLEVPQSLLKEDYGVVQRYVNDLYNQLSRYMDFGQNPLSLELFIINKNVYNQDEKLKIRFLTIL